MQNDVEKAVLENDKIYNSQDKFDFLRETFDLESDVQTASLFVGLFESTGEIERELDTDLCAFSTFGLLTIFERRNWVSWHTFYTNKSRILKYLNWASSKDKIPQENVKRIEGLRMLDVSGNDVFVQSFFRDYEDLGNTISGIINEAFENKLIIDPNQHLMVECLLGLLWLRPDNTEDVYIIKKSDIDAPNKVVNIGGKAYKINDILLDKLVRYSNLNKFRIKGNGIKLCTLINSNYLFRTTTTESINLNVVKIKLSSFTDLCSKLPVESQYHGREIMMKRIILSSLYSDIYEFEQSTGVKYTPGEYKVKRQILEAFSDEPVAFQINDFYKWRVAFYGE